MINENNATKVSMTDGKWMEILNETGLNDANEIQALTRSVFGYVRDARWRSKAVRGAVELTLGAAAREAGFRSVFASVGGKAMERGGFSKEECYVLSRLVCVVMDAAVRGGATDELTKALELCARLAARGPRAFASKALKAVVRLPDGASVVESYVSLIKACGASNPVVCALAGDIFSAARATSLDSDELRKDLLDAYCAVVLGADAKVIKAGVTSEMFASVLAAATEEDVKDIIMPKIVRQLRRSPESVMPTVLGALKAMELDLSESLAELAPVMIPLAKHANADRREISRSIIDALISKCSNVDLIAEHLFKPCANEFTTGKRPKEWTARVGSYGVLEACSCSGSDAARDAMGIDAMAVLATELIAEKQIEIGRASCRERVC